MELGFGPGTHRGEGGGGREWSKWRGGRRRFEMGVVGIGIGRGRDGGGGGLGCECGGGERV